MKGQLILLLRHFFIFAVVIIGASNSSILPHSEEKSNSSALNSDDLISVDEKIVFFSEKTILEMPTIPEVSSVHGKFISESNINSAETYEMELLNECSSFVYDLVDLKDSTKIKKRKDKFVKKFKAFLSKDHDQEKLSSSLRNRHCEHAIAACSVEDFGTKFLKKIFVDYPLVVETQLSLFGNLDEYSFMTEELADIYYKDCNYLLTPFALRALVETVSLPVMVHLLEKWDYDLRLEDARNVMEVWGKNDEFKIIVEIDPRSWLLWAQIGLYKPFPMDQLLAEFEGKNPFPKLYIYANMILAFVRDSEIYVSSSMSILEYIHADLHKNDVIQEENMTPEMVEAFDSRKWDLWNEWSQPQQDLISCLMISKNRLIEKLKSFKIDINSTSSNEYKNQLFLKHLISILSVPLNHFSRATFLKSRNFDELIAAKNIWYAQSFGPTSFPRIENLTNESYWTVLWRQLEVFGIEIVYDETLSKEFKELYKMSFLISGLAYAIKDFQKSVNMPVNVFWPSRLLLSIIAPMKDSFGTTRIFMNILNNLNGIHPIRIESHQIEVIKYFSHPSATENYFFKYEHGGFVVDAYLLKPEILSRDDINLLLMDVELRNISLKVKPENIMKLKYLNDFTADDFEEFFVIGGDFHLELHKSVYTADSSAVAAYFKVAQGACNYPEQLIWWSHPSAFVNLEFSDIVAEMIPFSAFMKHPRECEALNFAVVINDIVGRIQRNSSEDPHKLILKWLLNMEWIVFQYFNYHFVGNDHPHGIAVVQFDTILKAFQFSRTKLIQWIHDPVNVGALAEKEPILRLIEWIPLSYLGASEVYQNALLELTGTEVRPGRTFRAIKDRFRDYKLFSSKSHSRISINDIETAVNESLSLCKELIERHFGIIEKQIWLGRIKMFSFASVLKYTSHPIPKNYVFNIINYKMAPHNDLKIFFIFLARQGHAHFVMNIDLGDSNSENLEKNPELANIQARLLKVFEEFIMTKRGLLLKIDVENAKKAKK